MRIYTEPVEVVFGNALLELRLSFVLPECLSRTMCWLKMCTEGLFWRKSLFKKDVVRS